MAKKETNEESDMGADQPIDPMAVMSRLAAALESMSQRQQSTPSDQTQELMLRLSSALERVSEAQIEGSKLIAQETRRANRPSNEISTGISVFNRRGNLPGGVNAKPKLKCIMMVPFLVEWESATREEVELLNLLQPGEYLLKRIDNSKVRVTITIDLRVDGKTPSRLVVTHDTAFNNDNFRMMPPLSDILRQYLKQHEKDVAAQAAAVLTDEEEEALIEAGQLSIAS